MKVKTRSFVLCFAVLFTIYFQFKIIQHGAKKSSYRGDSKHRHQLENLLVKPWRNSIRKQPGDIEISAASLEAYTPVPGNYHIYGDKNNSIHSSSREYDFGIRPISEELHKPTRSKANEHSELPPYKLFNERIGLGGKLYQDEFADDIRSLERSLVESKIIAVNIPESGTQLKWESVLQDGNRVLVKPMRAPRGFMTGRDWIGDIERHTSEIAAYHLDRILGFNRVPVTVGRIINITRELRDLVKDEAFLKTFSIMNGEHCFYGVCSGPFCKPDAKICADNELLEVSMTTYVFKPWHEEVNPWTFNPDRVDIWGKANICNEVLSKEFIGDEHALLNLIDSSILDFLLRNYDRHAYAYFPDLGMSAMFLHYDHGKSFGNFTDDDLRILAPLVQCQR
ncbi:extracellular serine/threonine protein kinase FAM20C-like [Anneissia japonica]|uniref:extracellular serine/threonine protein kinase FAM20C-like n=1 Tax=Anneissia japonica TaxID=1529436 RepID=UPI0014255C73|nr:extracellular serine/threonine protein kinase FAM20C-like [Anneissia japonica]